MDAERYQQVKAVLDAALELEPEEQAAFLDDSCANDPELRGAVETLLVAHAKAQNFLEHPGAADGMTVAVKGPDGTPERIGPYKILETLGEGGMGVVYLAEQVEPIRRRVALKLIKLGMDSKAVIARFESERQALALMNHPNVAKVVEAGTTEQGRPYFVMEYVKGVPITVHCDRQRLTTTERLRLFMQVCEGVQHAHQKGIIHRDLKPSNILVSIEGEKAVPKIIDFGVAKATEHRLTEQTVFTQLGQIIGTPEYMSPEQAEMTEQDIDIRTDVYSLGVILYELLVGVLPFDPKELRQAGFDEIRRTIREEEPSKPSTRFSNLGDTSTASAKKRQTDPTSLVRQLRGDLDWITMKALEKDRTRRYETPLALGADVLRHINNEPVVAGPPSRAYRARKFTKRHRLALTVGVAAGIAIATIAVLGVSIQALRSQRGLTRIRAALEQAVATGERAAVLEPQWDQLKLRLVDHFRQAGGVVERPGRDLVFQRLLLSDDELGHSTRRASAQMELDIASFGLESRPPELVFTYPMDVLDLYDPFLKLSEFYIADIEISWDGGNWALIKTHTSHLTGGHSFTVQLSSVLSTAELSAGPHRVAGRVAYSFLSDLSQSEQDQLQVYSVWDGPDVEWLHQSDRPAAVLKEVRSLGVHEINLYSEYPADFPRVIPWDSSNGTLESWLAIEKVLILRVNLPDGEPAALFSATYEGRGVSTQTPFPLNERNDWVVSYSLLGRIRKDVPQRVAFMVTLSNSETDQELGSFPFVVGHQKLYGFGFSTASNKTDPAVLTEVNISQTPPWRLEQPINDGTFRGRIQLVPSRELALETKRFQDYVGDVISLEVPIKIVTIQAEWGPLDE